jgi:tRNA A-37 threonylcarbamoyl transferase component Bud32
MQQISKMFIGAIARVASWIAINQVAFGDDGLAHKSRRRWAWLPMFFGNGVLRLRSVPVEVLSSTDWIAREKLLSNLMGCDSVFAANSNSITLQRVRGIPLSEFLAGASADQCKETAVAVALRALFEFHQCTNDSHGDASATNVMISESGDEMTAQWFDFDLAHRKNSAIEFRYADDLRALLYTSMVHFPCDAKPRLIEMAREVYPTAKVWDAYDRLFAKEKLIRDAFHRAQLLRSRL